MKKLILAFIFTSTALAQTLHLGQPIDNTGNGPAGSSILGASTVTVTSTACNTLTASGCSVSANGPYVKTLNFMGSPGGAFTVTGAIAPGHEICASNATGQAGAVGGGAGTTVAVPDGTGIGSTAAICMLSRDGVNYVQSGGGASSGITTQTNGTNNPVQTNLNVQNSATISWTNPSAGNWQANRFDSVLNYGGIKNGTGDNSTAITAACTANGQVFFPVGTYNFTGNYTTPAGCGMDFQIGAALLAPNGVTITLNSVFHAFNYQQIFTWTGTGAYAGLTGSVPVELFGAVGDGAIVLGGSGTNNTVAIQKTISATFGGCALIGPHVYLISSALTLPADNQGICGLSFGYPSLNPQNISVIMQTSASADIIDVGSSFGGSCSAFTGFNRITGLTLQRVVLPTGTAKGLSISCTLATTANQISSQDSIEDFNFHGAPSLGSSVLENLVAGWGFSVVTSYTNQTLIGKHLDSSGGVAENSIETRTTGTGVGSSLSSATTISTLIDGPQINDITMNGEGAAQTSYGMVVNYTGTGNSDSCADIHVNFPSYDAIKVSAFKITGIAASCIGSFIAMGGYTVGDLSGATGQKIIDVENSFGVQFNAMQIFGGAGSQIGIYANGSTNLSVTGIKCQDLVGPVGGGAGSGTCVQLNNTTGSVVNGNTFSGNCGVGCGGASPSTLTAGLKLTNGSIGNSIGTNVVNGFAAVGYSFDSTSKANSFDPDSNSCSGSVTTCTSGLNFTVATLPAASSVASGAKYLVTDATTFTPGACVGGGADTMIAVSDGSAWTCH